MYFWDTKALSRQIKDEKVSEQERKNYYLAIMILCSGSIFLLGGTQNEITWDLIVSSFVNLVITIIGINLSFKTNQGKQGKYFIERMVLLAFPISLKIIIGTFLFIQIFGILELVFKLDLSTFWRYLGLTLGAFMNCLFYWRVIVHLKYINT